jgi:hypothetical protein
LTYKTGYVSLYIELRIKGVKKMGAISGVVTQICVLVMTNDHTNFKGQLTLNDTEYEFELNFLIPVHFYRYEIEENKNTEPYDVTRIVLKKNGLVIPLEKREQNFFFYLVASDVFEMHEDWMKQNEIERENDDEAQSGGAYIIALSSEALKILSQNKFQYNFLEYLKVSKKRLH